MGRETLAGQTGGRAGHEKLMSSFCPASQNLVLQCSYCTVNEDKDHWLERIKAIGSVYTVGALGAIC